MCTSLVPSFEFMRRICSPLGCVIRVCNCCWETCLKWIPFGLQSHYTNTLKKETPTSTSQQLLSPMSKNPLVRKPTSSSGVLAFCSPFGLRKPCGFSAEAPSVRKAWLKDGPCGGVAMGPHSPMGQRWKSMATRSCESWVREEELFEQRHGLRYQPVLGGFKRTPQEESKPLWEVPPQK